MTITTFHDWESDACRIHDDGRGNLTADIYRPGRGIVPVAVVDVEWGGCRISEPAYMRLVAFHDAAGGKSSGLRPRF